MNHGGTDKGLAGMLTRVSATLLRLVLGVGVQVGIVVLTARCLGPTGNGQYTMAILLPVLLVTLLNLGLPASMVYHIAARKLGYAAGWKRARRVLLAVIPAGLAIGAALAVFLRGSLFPGVGLWPLAAGVAFFPVAILALVASAFLQAGQHLRAWNTVQVAPAVATLLLLVALALTHLLSVLAAVLAWGAGQTVAALLALAFLRRARAQAGPDVALADAGEGFLGYGLVSHGSNVLTWLNYRMDVFLVNLILGPFTTGLYAVAVQIGERLWLLSHAAAAVLFPRLSELDGRDAERRRLTPVAARWVTYVGVAGTLVLLPLLNPLVRFLFGPDYLPAVTALYWLFPGLLAHNVTRILAADLAGRGRPSLNLIASLATFVVNLGGNLLLIPRYGMVGAAIATSGAYLLTLGMCLYFYVREAGVPWGEAILPRRYDLHLLKQLFARFVGRKVS